MPGVVGVPLSVPLFNVRPGGREEPLASAMLTGAVPPAVVIVVVYGTFVTAPGSGDGVEKVRPVATVSAKVRVAVCAVGVDWSVALTVKLKLPPAVGEPVSVPLGASVRPAGKLPPVRLNVAVPTPPLVAMVVEYVCPCTASGSGEFVLMLNPGWMVSWNVLVALCCGLPESVAETVNENVPALVGAPLIVPLLKVSPAGSEEPLASASVTGAVPPLVAIVTLYPEPCVAFGSGVAVVMASPGTTLSANVREAVCGVGED